MQSTKSSGKLKDPRVCRIFFSSPFNGMEGEREELTRRYWPQIQSLCSSKGVQFVPVDMRWGITTQSSSDFQTINICLREIDRSDMFIGFFGQRYGWQGEKDEALQQSFDAAVGTYPWLEEHRNKSVTELEFLHGHLNRPGLMPACICFRDKAYDDLKRNEAKIAGDKKGVYKFSAESDLAVTLMDDLKARVKAAEDKSLGVHVDYKDPAEGAHHMFTAIWKYLTEVLLKDVRQGAGLSKREQEWQEHDTFCTTQCGLYEGGEQYITQLNSFVSSQDASQVMVVTGPPGSGKTALLCNWIRQQQDHKADEDILIYHFVGCSSLSSTVSNILERMVSNLHHGLQSVSSKALHLEGKTDHQLVSLWLQLLEEASEARKRVWHVVDGVGNIQAESKIHKPLYWLPEKLPKNVHVILSTQSEDEQSLEELFNKRGYAKMELNPLDSQTISILSKDILKVRGKELSKEQLEKVVNADGTSMPLFLRIVLEELCMFGKFRELDQKIDSLINCSSSGELFNQVLLRLEADYNNPDFKINIVEKVLTALAGSRFGLQENELTEMFDLPSHVWSPLYYSLKQYLTDRQGFLSLARQELQQAVVKKYMDTHDKKKQVYNEQAAFFLRQYQWHEQENVDVPNYYITELPWLAMQAEDKPTLKQILSKIFVFEKLLGQNKYELLEFIHWLPLSQEEFIQTWDRNINTWMTDVYHDALEELLETCPNPAPVACKVMMNLVVFLEFAKYHKAEEHFLLRVKHILEVNQGIEETRKWTMYQEALYKLACLYSDRLEYQQSVDLHRQIIEAYEKKSSKSDHDYVMIGYTYHGCAGSLLGLKQHEEAEAMLKKSIASHQFIPNEPDNKKNEAKSLALLAESYAQRGDFESAVKQIQQAIAIGEEEYFGQLPVETSYLLTNLGIYFRRLGQFDNAEEVYTRAMKIKENALGWYHNDVAMACCNMANLARDRGDYETTMDYLKKSLDIYKHVGNWDSVDARNTKENLLLLYITLQQQGKTVMGEGLNLYWDVFNHMKERDEFHRGIPYVHENYMRYMTHCKEYENVLKVATTLVRTDAMRSPLQYGFICYIDRELMPPEDGSVRQRPQEESLDTGLKRFPGDQWLVELKMQYDLVPSRDLEGLNSVIDNFHSASDGAQGADEKDVMIIVCAQELCTKAGWIEGALAILEKYRSTKFPDSGILLKNLAVMYHMTQEWDKSLECFQQACQVYPDDFILKEKVAFLLLRDGQLEKAEDTIAEIESRWSKDETAIAKAKTLRGILKEVQEKMASEGQSQE